PLTLPLLPAARQRVSFFSLPRAPRVLPSFPTRRSSDLRVVGHAVGRHRDAAHYLEAGLGTARHPHRAHRAVLERDVGVHLVQVRSEEHTSELQSRENLVCRLLLEKKNGRSGVATTEVNS